MVYEDYGHVAPGLPEKGTLREKRKKKTDRMELKAPLHFAGSAADAVKEMAKKGVTPPFKKIVHNVSNHTSIVLNLRTITRWVDELWAARIQAAHRDGMQNLSMDPVASCGDEFGVFIWNHFTSKYGTASEAGVHVGDFVTSLRHHRETSHRVRIFSEFAGVDLRRPQKALSMHIVLVDQLLHGTPFVSRVMCLGKVYLTC